MLICTAHRNHRMERNITFADVRCAHLKLNIHISATINFKVIIPNILWKKHEKKNVIRPHRQLPYHMDMCVAVTYSCAISFWVPKIKNCHLRVSLFLNIIDDHALNVHIYRFHFDSMITVKEFNEAKINNSTRGEKAI